MSQENVEVVRRTWEIALRGRADPGAAFDQCVREGLLAPNVESRLGARGGMAVAGLDNVVGRDEYLKMLRSFTEDFEAFRVEVEQIIDAGNDRVVAITRFSGTGKGSGMPVEMRMASVYSLEIMTSRPRGTEVQGGFRYYLDQTRAYRFVSAEPFDCFGDTVVCESRGR
jgi:ketosteroid isomerase-like protein